MSSFIPLLLIFLVFYLSAAKSKNKKARDAEKAKQAAPRTPGTPGAQPGKASAAGAQPTKVPSADSQPVKAAKTARSAKASDAGASERPARPGVATPHLPLGEIFSEGEDPCHTAPGNRDVSGEELFQGSLNFQSEEGKDPCHEEMLTAEPVSPVSLPVLQPALSDWARAFVLSEILKRPCERRQN